MTGTVRFRHRRDAGRRLAAAVRDLEHRSPIVLALPRGGVPVAAEVADALGAPLDIVLVRKVGVPGQREFAMGAVVDGERLELLVNEEVIRMLAISQHELRAEAKRQVAEIERRRRLYLEGGDRVRVAGHTALVVDDGIATGATVRAAVRAVRRRDPSRLVLAVPVAPRETLESLREEVDEIVCLATPSPFGAVGDFYDDFRQIEDDEVRQLLSASREAEADGAVGGAPS